MTGPAATPADIEVDPPAHEPEGSAAVDELVDAGLDDWLVDRIHTAGEDGMSLAAIQMAVWRRYGRWVGPIFLQARCDWLARDEGGTRIAAGPAWNHYRGLAAGSPAACVAGDEMED